MIVESLAYLPLDRPIQVEATFASLEDALDPLPDDAPLVFGYQPPLDSTFDSIVEEVATMLQQSAVDAFPTWLPGIEGLASFDGGQTEAARQLARTHAVATGRFSPFFISITELALGLPSHSTEFATELRITELARIVNESFGGRGLALLLQIDGTEPARRDFELALDWLCRRCHMGVWITGAPTDRFSRYSIKPPHVRPNPQVSVSSAQPKSGRPRSDSQAERLLEKELSLTYWSFDREWNKTLRIGTNLTSPICVDLVWLDQHLIVEIDGNEHRAKGKYAADRTRDNMLQLRGYTTLRFTNEQVKMDVSSVLKTIEIALLNKRHLRA